MPQRETTPVRLFRRAPDAFAWRRWLAGLLTALAPALAGASAEPEGLLIEHEGQWLPTLAMDTTVHMQVHGLLAEVTVRQTYRNDAGDWREGRYLLPLPENAAVGGLAMRVGERVIEGEIREKAEARAVYEAAAAAGQRASLVAQNRPNLFQTAVANIGPGEEIEIEVRYWQPVAYRDGVFSLGLPLTLTPRYTSAAGEGPFSPDAEVLHAADGSAEAGSALPPTLVLTAEIEAGLPLQRIDSPTHPVTAWAEGGIHRVTLRELVEASDRDFELEWAPVPSKAPRSAVFTDRVGGEDFALLMLVPPTLPVAPLPRELILVIDNSGSMSGASMTQAIEAADRALARLRPGDRFNLIRFDDDFDQLFPEAVPAEPANVARARAFVRALRAEGGTEMLPALEAAFAGRAPRGFLRQVVLATDAAIGNEDALISLIETRRGESRLFPVGIGSAPNGHFLRKAADAGRGMRIVIRDVNEVAREMDALLAKLDHPAMRDISVDWPGVAEAYPARVPDLYQGEALQVVARLDRADGIATVHGLTPQPWSRRLPLSLEKTTAAPGIGRLWGRARIEALEDDLRRGSDIETLKPAIVDVALRHGLVSTYTSLVAVDRTPSRPTGETMGSTRIANATPAGSLAFAQGSVGWERTLMVAFAVLLGGLLVVPYRGRPAALEEFRG